jgi:nucleoid-associated protein YgaU
VSSLAGRVVLSIAVLCFTLGPVAVAQQDASPIYLPIVIETSPPASVVVENGDHLWSISADHLEDHLEQPPSAAEITPYWREVIAQNVALLRSGDPNLIYPGETVVLPDAS